MFQRTKAISKLLALEKRKKVIQGGTWAGKTYGIVARLISFASANKNRAITVVAETIPAIKRGALKDFKEIMMSTGRWIESNYNGTDRIYKFSNGTTIEFNSFDSVGKAQAAGKRTDLFINEAPYIAFDIADALMGRTSGNIWIDFNPTHEFWAHTEIIGQPDCDFIILRYTDNEALPDTILNELMLKKKKAETSQYWANWCRVYIDGEIGNLDGAVFPTWKLLDEIPKDVILLGIGLDFGYTNDPSAAVALYKWQDKIIFDEILYKTGCSNSDLFNAVKDFKTLIVADSAEPKTIQELNLRGLRIVAAEKGAGSIATGISIINEQEIYITSRSTNLIKEIRAYVYEKDKNGKPTNQPIGFSNHAMDAIRYISMRFLKQPVKAKPFKILGK